MRAIFNGSTDPYFNLAAEEYLLYAACDDIFMLWRNAPSVIIGKNQNAWAEVDVDYVKEHGIPVVRRLTGGGAVFHDPGNVNFTFITKADDSSKLNFEKFTRPIIEALSSLGVKASLDGRNDLVAEGERRGLADDFLCACCEVADVHHLLSCCGKALGKFGTVGIYGDTVFRNNDIDATARRDECSYLVNDARNAAA